MTAACSCPCDCHITAWPSTPSLQTFPGAGAGILLLRSQERRAQLGTRCSGAEGQPQNVHSIL